MRNPIHLFAILFFLLLPVVASGYTAQDYLPNQLHDTWEYEVIGRHHATTTQGLQVVQRAGGWSRVDGMLGNQWLWMSANSGMIWCWNPASSTVEVLFDLDTPQGQELTAQASAISCMAGTRYLVAARNATVTTPVGRLHNCLVLERTFTHCRDTGLTRLVFAPGVGLVEFGEMMITGMQTGRLVQATVNGQAHGSQAALQVQLDLDAYRIVHTVPGVPPPGGVRRPSTLAVRFELANLSRQDLSFLHMGGQQYDFVIKDDGGRQVYRWGAGRAFTRNIWTDVMAPGSRRVFRETLPLQDSRGNPLPAGTYTVEAVHHSDPPETRFTARARFELEVIYAP